MEQIIALDIGDTRVGIARADSMGLVVTPINTIELKDLMSNLQVLTEEYLVKKVIIGIPKNMDGSEGDQAIKTKNIANDIRNDFPKLELVLEDERLTSEAALERLASQGIKINQKNKHLVDMHAAAIILEQYLSHATK